MSNRDIGAFEKDLQDIGAFSGAAGAAQTYQVTSTAAIALSVSAAVTVPTYNVTSTAAIALSALGAVGIHAWRKIALEGIDATFAGLTTTGNIELGHASDTTFARVSAGVVSIEGTNIAMVGGAHHDGFSDFVANEHIDHSTITLTAGTGLTGGGTIAANRTFAVDGVLEDLDTLGAAASDGQFIVATGAGAFAYEAATTARTSLGVGTGDSPQFTGIELGHATDSTITRVSAGVLAVEGVNIMMVGAAPTAHVHDGDTLQFDGINSNGGAFAFTTTGAVTFNQDVVVNANAASPQTAPANTILHVAGVDGIYMRGTLDGYGGEPSLTFRRANGTAALPTALQAGDSVGEFSFHGYGATGYSSNGQAHFVCKAAENWTDAAQGTYLTIDTCPIGSVLEVERLRIDSTGYVHIGSAGTPSTWLHLEGTHVATKGIMYLEGTTHAYVGLNAAAASEVGFLFNVAGTPAWQVRCDGNAANVFQITDRAGGTFPRLSIAVGGVVSIGSLDGIIKGTAGALSAITDNSANWDAASAHVSATGASHSYLDQAVTVAASPQFGGLTVKGTGAQTLLKLGDDTTDGGYVTLQFHSDYGGDPANPGKWKFEVLNTSFYMYNEQAGHYVWTIDTAGNFVVNTGSLTAPSLNANDGANFNGAITNLTIVNGICTAAS